MRNPLQEQLLKAGLVKKAKVAEVVRQQARQRQGKAPPPDKAVDAQRLQAERAERDRALAAERNAEARAHEQAAQARQIIETHKLPVRGDMPYHFTDAGSIRNLPVDAGQRGQLATGALVIARHGDSYALLARDAADKVLAREAALVVLDHRGDHDQDSDGDDRFKVPDDLIW